MYLAILTAAGIASLVLAAFAWRNRRYPGFAYFALVELAMAWWIWCYLGEQLDPGRERLWFALKFPAIGVIPPSWLLFVLFHVGERPRTRAWWAVYAWALLLGPLVYTNDTHRLFFTEIVRRHELVALNGPLFSFHLALSYTFTFVAVAMLYRDWRRRGRMQSGLMFAGALIPFAGNIVNELAKATPAIGDRVVYNPTLPGFAFSALFLGWATMRYRLLDPRPVARDALFESMPDAVLVLNESAVVVDANRAALRMLGLSERELLGLPWPHVFTAPEWRALPQGPDDLAEREWSRAGRSTWLEVQRRELQDSRGRSLGLLMVARDITARRQLEADLRAESYRDRLTGLSNRRFFDDEAQRLLASREFPVAVFAFDLDGLKQVNDRDGHAAGDLLLQTMAAFLTHFFRAGDRIIRQGGDEFLVLLTSTGVEEAERIRGRLPAALAQFNVGRQPALRFSAGLSVAADASDWSAALKRADDRLYDAKRIAGAVPV